MGKLTVYFVGICSHIKDNQSGEVPHRVVLHNWSKDDEINGRFIKEHRAALKILPQNLLGGGEAVDIPLAGVTITVNGTAPEPTYEDNLRPCLPHLKDFVSGPMQLSDEVVNGKKANLVAAYFDANGHFKARKGEKGCAITIMTVDTNGNPVVQLTNFDGTTQPPIELTDHARIQIENIEPGPSTIENDWDFLVHFKIFTTIPVDTRVPTKVDGCKPAEGVPYPPTVGPGCSNSAYP